MHVFLDFEASSLGDDSYPIEVGWVFEDGAAEDWLIRPAPGWTDWDPTAEAVHGIARARLEAEGAPHQAVAQRMLAALAAHQLYATAPSWDGKWLSVLLRAAGLPRHALRLTDSKEAHLAAARAALRDRTPADALEAAAAAVVRAARDRLAAAPVAHRALADARQELALWLEVRRVAGDGGPIKG
jgi:hypothetical protein